MTARFLEYITSQAEMAHHIGLHATGRAFQAHTRDVHVQVVISARPGYGIASPAAMMAKIDAP